MNKHIKLFGSLGVVFIIILHLAIPHAHHHHEDKEVVEHSKESSHHHTEGHDHQHPDDQDTDANENGFSLPSEKHLHAFHVHEFVPSSKSRDHTSPIKAFPFFAVITNYNDQPRAENKRSYRFALFRQILHENPFLLNCSLRAPPYTA